MSWTNPSAVIIKWREQLLACAVVDDLYDEEDFHYPQFAPSGETPDDILAVLLQESAHNRERIGEGMLPLVGGTLKAQFYLPEDVANDAGYMETFSRTVIAQLGAQYSGIAFREFDVALSSEPKPAARASGANTTSNLYRTVTITAMYGLSR